MFPDYDKYLVDGLTAAERRTTAQQQERAALRAAAKPKKPTLFAYNEALSRGAVDKPPLDATIRDRLVREAREAFEAVAKDLADNKREAVTARACGFLVPCVLPDVDSPETAARLAKRPEWSVYLNLQAALLKDLASCHLEQVGRRGQALPSRHQEEAHRDAAQAAAEPEKNVDLILVQIPYSDADALKARHNVIFDRPTIQWTKRSPREGDPVHDEAGGPLVLDSVRGVNFVRTRGFGFREQAFRSSVFGSSSRGRRPVLKAKPVSEIHSLLRQSRNALVAPVRTGLVR